MQHQKKFMYSMQSSSINGTVWEIYKYVCVWGEKY